MSTIFLTIVSVLAVSLVSLVGISLFAIRKNLIERLLLYFVSFSTGAMLGGVFLHMMPEMAEGRNVPFERQLFVVLMGIVLSFIIEKIIHWRHCHLLPFDNDCRHHHKSIGIMNLIGDGVHNFIDGAIIAGSFLVSIEIGIAATIAVALHEIPQEIDDFAILLYSGFSRGKALLFNLLSALTALIGAVLVLSTSTSLPLIGTYLIPLAAGNFLYIAGSDLIPELHKETRLPHAATQLLCMIGGIAIMYSLTIME